MNLTGAKHDYHLQVTWVSYVNNIIYHTYLMRILFRTVLVWLYNLFQSHNYFPLLLVLGFNVIKLSEPSL